MELEDLKKAIDNSVSVYKPAEKNATDLMDHESKTLFADLERKISIGLTPFPVTVVLFSALFASNAQARHSLLMWMLLGILCIEFIDLLFNYRLIKKLQNQSGNTKENFITKINRLETGFKRQFAITLLLYALMAIVLEIVIYYKADNNFRQWAETPVLLRVVSYVVFLIIQFFLKKYFYKKQFSEQMENLKSLIRQFQ